MASRVISTAPPSPPASVIPPTPSTLHSTFVSEDYNPLTGNSTSTFSALPPPAPVTSIQGIRRRSARLSIAASVAVPVSDQAEEEDGKPPVAKKQRGRPRTSSAINASTITSAVYVKVANDVDFDVKPDISSLAVASSSSQPISSAVAPPIARVRGRPSKASLAAAAALKDKSSSMAVEVEAGTAQVIKAESSAVKTKSQVAEGWSAKSGNVEKKAKAEDLEEAAGPSTSVAVVTKGKAKVKKEKAPVDPKKERYARVRAKCPKTIHDRYKRAVSQRMFMLERQRLGDGSLLAERFKVLGSTGNVYTVNIGARPLCDCPDCRRGNLPCKHIIFVFNKVLKIPDESSLWYQKSLTAEELEEVFTHAPPTPTAAVSVSTKVRDAYLRATGVLHNDAEPSAEEGDDAKGMLVIGEDCPVCYDEITQGDVKGKKLVFDEAVGGCGKPLHKQCFEMWAMTAKNKGDQVTCVWCRSLWPGQSVGKGKGRGPEYTAGGYLNMAEAAGMSRQRDVSTYHWGRRYLNSD